MSKVFPLLPCSIHNYKKQSVITFLLVLKAPCLWPSHTPLEIGVTQEIDINCKKATRLTSRCDALLPLFKGCAFAKRDPPE